MSNELLSDKVAQLEVSMQRLVEHIAEVTKQRDDLVEALIYARRRIYFLHQYTEGMVSPTPMESIDSAIANATKP